jgi:hypothetical protein
LEAAHHNLPWAIVSLGMVWAVIGFQLYCLRELVAVNSRMRRLYERSETPASERPARGTGSLRTS